MALAETTLSSALAADGRSLLVASATSIAAGRLIEIDGEIMQVAKDYVAASTTVPVIRGQQGTPQFAHPSGARVTHGEPSDWPDPLPGTAVNIPTAGIGRQRRSYSASGAITLPRAGGDMLALLNGTSVLAMTVAAPSKDMDGCRLTILADGAAAHTITFTGGLSLAGSFYDVLTMNGTGPIGVEVEACNERWICKVAVPMAGTVTNITGTVA